VNEAALLLDEMVSPAVARGLRERGWDVVAVCDRDDLVSRADAVILAAAAAESRMLVTFNIDDFVALHAEWEASGRSHSGIVLVSSITFPQNRGLVGALIAALEKLVAEAPLSGGVVFLQP
jgi:hypothetical protein